MTNAAGYTQGTRRQGKHSMIGILIVAHGTLGEALIGL